MQADLPPRQTEILDAIRAFIADRGYSPSIQEIADIMGAHLNAARQMLLRLERAGRIRRAAGHRQSISRSITLIDQAPPESMDGSHTHNQA